MYRFLARPRWIGFLLLVIAMIVACLLLARWQWHRLDQREAYNSVITNNIDQAPVSPAKVLKVGSPLPTADLWRSVAVSGRYDSDHVLLVRQRVVNGQPGFYVMTPFIGQDGVALWLNRGWIPVANTAATEPDVPEAPAGTVTVVARMRYAEVPRGPVARDLPARQIDRIDIPAMSEGLGVKAYGGYGEVVSEFPATTGGPTLIPAPEISDGPHLSYAIQWVTFAVVAGVGWYVLIRKEHERLLEERAAMEDQGPDPDADDPDVDEDDLRSDQRTTVEGNA